ncbi:hypothetical protein WBK50_22150 [Pseudonocardia sp. T1-2H]|uniref:hypothetical protein n=1 Tax=Pseudonocardia sp. T1-2H TaxID=3128899 RepID=UPI003100C648
MTYLVECDMREAGTVDEPAELFGDRVGVDRAAVGPAEEQAVVGVVATERALLVLELRDVGGEGSRGPAVEGEAAPGAFALAVGWLGLPGRYDACVPDGDRSRAEVDVREECGDRLRTADAGGGENSLWVPRTASYALRRDRLGGLIHEYLQVA